MATRTAQTFESKFMNGRQVKDADILEPRSFIPDPKRADYLWTLISTQMASGQMYWVPGWHLVNREGYLYSENPRTDNSPDEYRRW